MSNILKLQEGGESPAKEDVPGSTVSLAACASAE
jgi:hypothetical protein